MLERVFKECRINEGDFVKVKGTPKRGTVVKINNDVSSVQWERNRPLLLEVEINGQIHVAHPSQLKKVNKK